MSQVHLDDLRNTLESKSWRIAEELPGDDYGITATWLIRRPDGSHPVHIDFECVPDLEAKPIEQAIACYVRENEKISAYFARKDRTWPTELEKIHCWPLRVGRLTGRFWPTPAARVVV